MEITVTGVVATGMEGGFVLECLKQSYTDINEFVIHDTGLGWFWAAMVGEEVEVTGWVEADAPGAIVPVRITLNN